MFKRFSAVIVILFISVAGVHATEILSVSASAPPNPVYENFEIAFLLDSEYENPYNPEEVDVWATIILPSIESIRVNAFWYIPQASYLDADDNEIIQQAGDPDWRIRYAPMKEGLHRYRIHVADASGQTDSEEYQFIASAPISPGFVRVSEENPRYFRFDDGTSYVPFGANICWVRESAGYFRYIDYLDAMAENKGNWTRLWMSHFALGTALEWGDYHQTGYYEGLGHYSQQIAHKLDSMFGHAEGDGVYIQLVFHQHSQFESSMWSSWAENPYNAANGGPCATSADYFTDESAKTLASNLHRYIVARYAAFRSLMAWELWNEAELILGVGADLMVPWANEAAAEIRANDPQGHLVTTSYAIPLALPWFDLDTWDFNNRHEYEYGSWLNGILIDPYLDRGPLLLSEYGIDFEGELNARDTLGVNLHNGIWSALMFGYAGGAMNWWWDNYIDPFDLWSVNKAPAIFVGETNMTPFKTDLTVESAARGFFIHGAGIAAQDDDSVEAWVWIHDRDSDWWAPMDDSPAVENARIFISNIEDPENYDWTMETWNTWTGVITEDTTVLTVNGSFLILDIPSFERDIAFKIFGTALGDDDIVDDSSDDTDDTSDDATPDDDTNGSVDDASDDDDSSDEGGCGC